MSSRMKYGVSIQDQINEANKKLQLHEGDLKAYKESTTQQMNENKQLIHELTVTNKQLHKQLAQVLRGDEKVIEAALGDHKSEKQALKSKAGKDVVNIIDQKKCDKQKRLNAIRAQNDKKRRQLQELQTSKNLIEKDIKREEENCRGTSENARQLRTIENRLDKALLKQREAEHVKAIYEKMLAKLKEGALMFPTILEEKEQAVRMQEEELKRVEAMLAQAQSQRDRAKSQFHENEEELQRERRERDRMLQELRQRAEEKRGADALERRTTRMESRTGSTPGAVMDPVQDNALPQNNLEEEIAKYEDIYRAIKEATGVSSIDEAVSRFESQGETSKHLQNVKEENEKKINELKQQRLDLEAKFNTFKYSDADEAAKVEEELFQITQKTQENKKLANEYETKLERQNKLLLNVRSGVQHLCDKLDFVEGTGESVKPENPDVVADINSILERSGKQIDSLLQSLGEEGVEGAQERAGTDLTSWAITRVEETAPYSAIKSPGHHAARAPGDLSDDGSSGEEDGQMLTREEIKKQADALVKARNKKRGRPVKQKGRR